MTNHTYKLLVLDIDGTLVSGRGSISTDDREALAKARDLGIQVSLSTGRGIKASLSIIDQLSLDSFPRVLDVLLRLDRLTRNPR